MTEPTSEPEPSHSKAFENLVRGSDDLVGLLAYAKFKQSVHEAARSGAVVDRTSRNITPAMVDVLRSAAEQMIAQVVDDGIQAAAPDIEKSSLRTAMDSYFSETASTVREESGKVVSHIDRRTSFVTAFLTNLAAWAATLIIAVLIIFLYNRPSTESTILGTAQPKELENPSQQSAKPKQPQQPKTALENKVHS